MPESSVWLIDQIAAAALARDLGLTLSEHEIAAIAERMAEHRMSAFDLEVSRMQTKISNTLHAMLVDHARRNDEWSNGCLSAEAAILAMTSALLSDSRKFKPRSKGTILRAMIRQSRTNATSGRSDTGYRMNDTSSTGSVGSAV